MTTGFIFSLLSVAILTSFEGVMAMQDHEFCFSEKGSNVTLTFDIAFRIGFCVSFLDFLNSAFLEIYVTMMKNIDLIKHGHFSDKT